MKRSETVALLKELGAAKLLQPTLVLVEQRSPDKFQLRIKGDYNPQEIEIFLRNRGFSYEENKENLVIFKP